MNVDGRAWDTDILNDLFNACDRELILRIPLSIIPFTDSRYWIFDPGGGYSFKSCYRALQGEFSSQQCSVWQKFGL